MPDPANLPSAAEVARNLAALQYPPDVAADKVRGIYEAFLRDPPGVRAGNFTQIAPADLSLLFDLYDRQFFSGAVRRLLQLTNAPLLFQLSARLTRSAGVTKRFVLQRCGAAASQESPRPAMRYEIAISTTLLFQTFQDVQRTIRVNGLVCHDRLEALQRIFEHELLHLIEMLVWGRSSCSGDNFKALAWNYFAHTETKHDLVTQHERAHAQFDVRVGDRVAFELEGVRHVGRVNRITRRATVLVEDPRGQRYSDGKHYLKFYIPLPMLQKE
jgi:predicted SprT family Zn-dependent metalloprotease